MTYSYSVESAIQEPLDWKRQEVLLPKVDHDGTLLEKKIVSNVCLMEHVILFVFQFLFEISLIFMETKSHIFISFLKFYLKHTLSMEFETFYHNIFILLIHFIVVLISNHPIQIWRYIVQSNRQYNYRIGYIGSQRILERLSFPSLNSLNFWL